ncbi:MAG: hypothetical protein IPJ58_14950 [Ardenticatenia bacterium]|nr:hypothetical protein [Ardenticatenia bacterium]
MTQGVDAQIGPPDMSVERGGFYKLSAVAGLSESQLWAVGWNSLVRFDGAGWVLEHSFPADQEWTRLEAGESAIYGIGHLCNLLEIRDKLHVVHTIPNTCHLHDLSIISDGDVWLAGGDATDKKSHIVRWKDGKSQDVVVPDVGQITAIYMNNDLTGWAFGPRGILKGADGEWKIHQPGLLNQYSIRAIDASSPNDIWAVGGTSMFDSDNVQLILHYDGQQWSVWRQWDRHHEGSHRRLNDIAMFDDGTGWAVGDGFDIF